MELVIRRSEDSSTDVRWRATPVIECQFSNPDVLQSPLGPSVFRRDKTTTAVLTCPSLYSSIPPSSGQFPRTQTSVATTVADSLSLRPIPISLFWPLTAPLSTRGTASRIRQELSPPNYTVKHCHRPLMRTYYVSMDVLQPRSDQGTASQMVPSGGPFSTTYIHMILQRCIIASGCLLSVGTLSVKNCCPTCYN